MITMDSEQPHKTNFERWMHFNRDNPSPEQFLVFGFYYMIAAALQRRVWVGSELNPLFPNIYVMLVGKPGIGKGQVIKPITAILKHWKANQQLASSEKKPAAAGEVSLEQLEHSSKLQDEMREMVEALSGNPKPKNHGAKEEKLLIPIAPDATTYEALCTSLAKSFRAINYKKYDPKLEKEVTKIYGHSSLAFSLEETGSLFRKKTEDTVNLLLQAYDCGDYTKETRTQGNDYIKRCCLNFLGGTTPDFMQQVFNDALLNQGFSSRTFFIFATNLRFYKLNMAEHTAEQKQDREVLLQHIKNLTLLYGACSFTEDANEFLKHWWEIEQTNNLSSWRANMSNKLDAYYARKQIHVMKMSMILHFAEAHIDPQNPRQTNMVISLDTVQRAMKLLEIAEASMHYALQLSTSNPLAQITKKVVRYLEQTTHTGATFMDLLKEFWDELPTGEMDLREVLKYLIGAGQVVEEPTKGVTQYKLTKFRQREEGDTLE